MEQPLSFVTSELTFEMIKYMYYAYCLMIYINIQYTRHVITYNMRFNFDGLYLFYDR